MKENRENLECNNTENSFNWFLEKLNQPITLYITKLFNCSLVTRQLVSYNQICAPVQKASQHFSSSIIKVTNDSDNYPHTTVYFKKSLFYP